MKWAFTEADWPYYGKLTKASHFKWLLEEMALGEYKKGAARLKKEGLSETIQMTRCQNLLIPVKIYPALVAVHEVYHPRRKNGK